jgi:hypothetical protein
MPTPVRHGNAAMWVLSPISASGLILAPPDWGQVSRIQRGEHLFRHRKRHKSGVKELQGWAFAGGKEFFRAAGQGKGKLVIVMVGMRPRAAESWFGRRQCVPECV